MAQEDADGKPLKVGDLVEVDFHGKQVAKILKFERSRVVCEVEFNGKKKEWPFPQSWVKLAESSQTSDKSIAHNAKMRTWNDATGSYSVKATLLSAENGKVKLKKEDGRVLTLPVAKLSEEDNAYLKELEKAAAAEADENNPFAGGEKETDSSGIESKSGAKPTSAMVVPEISNSIVLSQSEWNVKPDPGTTAAHSNKIVNIKTNMTEHEFHNKVSPVLSPSGGILGASITNSFEDSMEIMAIDLKTGRAGNPASIDMEKAKMIAIADDGKTAVTVLDRRGSDPGRLDFWKLSDDGSANNTASWKTADFRDRDGFEPKSGRLISPSRLLTFGRSVVLWDCETAEALYSITLPRGTTPVLSPGGKQLAIIDGKSIYFASVDSGEMLGMISTPDAPVQLVAFSQNGRFLAGLTRATGEISVWDLTNQEVIRQLSAPGGSGSSIQWCGDEYLLVNDEALMDVELRATVWNYSSRSGSIIQGGDGRFWFVSKAKVTPIKLPHKNLDALTAKFDPEDLLLLKPGVEVSIKLDTTFARSVENDILEKLTSALEERKVKVRDDAELQIVGTLKTQKRKTVEVSSMFNRFGRRGPTEKISYTPSLATLHFTKDGKKLWGKSRVFGPGGIIHSNRDESTQQAATRMCKPQPSFFTAMKFPKYIGQLPAGVSAGKSTISDRGVQ